MKKAATRALASLAKDEPIPEYEFGKDYIIPKPFDKRLLPHVSTAVAKAAIESGVARKQLNLVEYKEKLENIAHKTFDLE